MSHLDFKLSYDGPAVEAGRMDVRDLAPALLAIGNLMEATNRLVNGSNASAKVQVKTVGAGSFAISLDVSVRFLQTVKDLLTGSEASAATNLITILTGAGTVGVGAIALIRKMRGRSPSKISSAENGRVKVEIDGLLIEVSEDVARVAVDSSVRLALERVVAEPLAREGIDKVSFGALEKLEQIEKADGFAFLMPPNREGGAYEYRYRAPLSIVSLSFKEGNKWRLHDGKAVLSATVTDDDFSRRVDRSEEAFSKGDILICDIRVVTREDFNGLRSEYFVERVVEHRRPMRQQSLFAEKEKHDSSDGGSNDSESSKLDKG